MSTDSVVQAILDYYNGIGFFFALAFLMIVQAFAYLSVRWSRERRLLRTDAQELQAIVDSLESPEGSLYALVRRRVAGDPSVDSIPELASRPDFNRWILRNHVNAVRPMNSTRQNQGFLLRDYLYSVLTSPRARLTTADSRLTLTKPRNILRKHEYHRTMNAGLASTAVSLGILGTVAGLWLAFRQADFSNVSELGDSLSLVMISLSRALYTTGTGIILSIPISAMGARIEGQLEVIYGQLEEVQEVVIATIRELEVAGPQESRVLEDEVSEGEVTEVVVTKGLATSSEATEGNVTENLESGHALAI